LSPNISQDPFFFVKNQFVFEPYYVYAKSLKKQTSFSVIFGTGTAKVSCAVKLNCELFRGTIEIKYVAANAVLSSKFSAIKPGVFQDGPQTSFRRRQLLAKLRPESLEFGKGVNVCSASFERHFVN